jgi:hypothetical protein
VDLGNSLKQESPSPITAEIDILDQLSAELA